MLNLMGMVVERSRRRRTNVVVSIEDRGRRLIIISFFHATINRISCWRWWNSGKAGGDGGH